MRCALSYCFWRLRFASAAYRKNRWQALRRMFGVSGRARPRMARACHFHPPQLPLLCGDAIVADRDLVQSVGIYAHVFTIQLGGGADLARNTPNGSRGFSSLAAHFILSDSL